MINNATDLVLRMSAILHTLRIAAIKRESHLSCRHCIKATQN